MCSGFLKGGVKRTFKTGKNFSQAENMPWYLRHHSETSTHPKFGCSTQNF